MEHSRKRMRFEIMIDRYFSNFFRIVLTNLLFFVPTCALFGLGYLARGIESQVLSLMVFALLLALLFPFYAGVVYVCRNIARGDKEVRVFSEFMKGIKDNFRQFLVMGFMFSLVAVFSYFSLSLYTGLLSTSWVFYVLLFICIVITLCVLFIMFYAPVMACTFDLSLFNIIRNSFLMSFGELKNNFKALLSLIIVLALALTATVFSETVTVLLIVLAAVMSVFLPASCQFVVSFYVYDDMFESITNNANKLSDINAAIDDTKDKRDNTRKADTEDYSDVDISTLKDTDDYIFYKGKMIKQSVLLRLASEQQLSVITDSEED